MAGLGFMWPDGQQTHHFCSKSVRYLHQVTRSHPSHRKGSFSVSQCQTEVLGPALVALPDPEPLTSPPSLAQVQVEMFQRPDL